MAYPVISLFCGAGGLDRGFNKAGFETLVAFDHDPDAVKTYNLNAEGETAVEADIAMIKPQAIFDILDDVAPCATPVGLIGGPPCQGFSRGNVHADPNDPRNVLPLKYAEILKAADRRYRLHFYAFENVTGILQAKHGERYGKICEALADAGFRVFTARLNASDFGVPQRRRRLFIVGLNKTIYPDQKFDFPAGDADIVTVEKVLKDLPRPAFFKRGLTPDEIPHHPNHWTMKPKSVKFKSKVKSSGRSFRRLRWDSVSPTVAYGNREIHVHPDGDRRLSIYEAMLLQGFPSTYEITGSLSSQVTQVSNAVPPPVAFAIASEIKQIIRRSQKHMSAR